MRTLKNYSLIYDDSCPLCQSYSKAFVNTGLLNEENREAYQNMSENTCMLIDKRRACNEIALVNKKTGEVLYGIDSILKIITTPLPILNRFLTFKPIYWLLKKCYSFISYNRKVIMPNNEKLDNCIPDFNMKYRVLYILFTWIFTSFVLLKFSYHITKFIPESNFGREFFICGGQIVFQSLILIRYSSRQKMDYLGNMMTISFLGSLLIYVGIGLGNKLNFSENAFIIYFLTVAFFMFIEHFRRMKLIQMPKTVSYTWLIYRLIILFIIL